MTNKEKVDVLNELINKYAESPNPHEHDMVFNVLKEIKNDIASKEEPVSEDLIIELKSIVNIRELAHQGIPVVKIARHIANWQKEQMMKNAVDGKVIARFPLASEPLYIDAEIFVKYAKNLNEGDYVKVIIVKED